MIFNALQRLKADISKPGSKKNASTVAVESPQFTDSEMKSLRAQRQRANEAARAEVIASGKTIHPRMAALKASRSDSEQSNGNENCPRGEGDRLLR